MEPQLRVPLMPLAWLLVVINEMGVTDSFCVSVSVCVNESIELVWWIGQSLKLAHILCFAEGDKRREKGMNKGMIEGLMLKAKLETRKQMTF